MTINWPIITVQLFSVFRWCVGLAIVILNLKKKKTNFPLLIQHANFTWQLFLCVFVLMHSGYKMDGTDTKQQQQFSSQNNSISELVIMIWLTCNNGTCARFNANKILSRILKIHDYSSSWNGDWFLFRSIRCNATNKIFFGAVCSVLKWIFFLQISFCLSDGKTIYKWDHNLFIMHRIFSRFYTWFYGF